MKHDNKHTDQINNLILSFLNRTIAPTDLKTLKEWLDESEENKSYFSEIQKVWLISPLREKDDFDRVKEQAFMRFKERVARKEQKETPVRIRPLWHRVAYMAACLIMAFLAGVGTLYFSDSHQLSQQPLAYAVESPRGSTVKMTLPDGSCVWLNADSKIYYDSKFGISNRNIELLGEGYFEVSKNKELPFHVISDDVKVEVLGTKFNVRNYPEDQLIKVALMEGSVALKNPLGETTLKPGQIACYNKKERSTQLKSVGVKNANAWINGHLYFDEENMENIALALERAFDVDITIKDDTLKKMIFYGDFVIESNNLTEIMNIMAATNKFNYHYEPRKNTIEIFQ